MYFTFKRDYYIIYKCDKLHFDDKIPVGVALGYAERENGETFSETVHRADIVMYSEKEKFYKEKGLDRRKK